MMVWYVQDGVIYADVPTSSCGCEYHYVGVPVSVAEDLGLVEVVAAMISAHNKGAGTCPYP